MRMTIRVLIKAFLLTVFLGGGIFFAYSWLQLDAFSLYNRLWQGRERFPFANHPKSDFNLNVENLDAMINSHVISAVGMKGTDELRIVVIGDSAAWGVFLRPEETFSGQLDGMKIRIEETDKTLDVYNLSYPFSSIQRDLVILNRAMDFEPDIVIWAMTFESILTERIRYLGLIGDDGSAYNEIAEKWGLSQRAEVFPRTIMQKRRTVSDIIRLQLYGYLWTATGIDHDFPKIPVQAGNDLQGGKTFYGYEGPLPMEIQAWDAIEVGIQIAQNAKVILVNEPMLIATGKNHETHYNFYPRIAYDAWHETWVERCNEREWNCLDAWNILPPERFTNSALHHDKKGAAILTELILEKLTDVIQEH